MPISLYLTAHQPAKRSRLIRSSIHSIPIALYTEDGYRQSVLPLLDICGRAPQSNMVGQAFKANCTILISKAQVLRMLPALCVVT